MFSLFSSRFLLVTWYALCLLACINVDYFLPPTNFTLKRPPLHLYQYLFRSHTDDRCYRRPIFFSTLRVRRKLLFIVHLEASTTELKHLLSSTRPSTSPLQRAASSGICSRYTTSSTLDEHSDFTISKGINDYGSITYQDWRNA